MDKNVNNDVNKDPPIGALQENMTCLLCRELKSNSLSDVSFVEQSMT